MMKKKCFWAATIFWLAAAATAEAKIKVIDGDSLFIGKREIRLSGIDAPEYDQICYDGKGKKYHCGIKARKALEDMIDGRLTCRKVTLDRYRREVAVCSVEDENINRRMVMEGWAVSYNQYTHNYDAAEEEARAAKRGIWSGRFMRPELYRALRRKE